MKKILIFILVFLSLISVSYAYTPNNNLVVYYPFDNNANDNSGNSRDATASGVTFNGTNAIFTGTTQYIDLPDLTGEIDYQQETLNFWVWGDSAESAIEYLFVDKGNADAFIGFFYDNTPTDTFRPRIKTGSSFNSLSPRNNSWNMVSVVMGTTNYEVYVNGVSTGTGSIGSGTGNEEIRLGLSAGSTFPFNGYMRDWSYFNTTLNSSNIEDIYLNGIILSSTPQISTNLTSFVNKGTFTSSATTTSNVNMSLYLNGTLDSTICNNCNSSTFNLSLPLGFTAVGLRSEDINGVRWNNISTQYNSNHFFRFFDTVRSVYTQDYSLTDATVTGQYAIINTSDLLPYNTNNSKTYTLFGYEQENFNINLTGLSTQLNQTFNVTPVTINIAVFDADTLSPLTFNLSLSNGSNTLTETNIGNYSEFYNNTLTGSVTATINSNGYGESNLFYSVDPLSTTTNNVYLNLINDSTPVIFRALELSQTQAISNATFSFYTKSGNYLGQKRTDSSGFLYFYLDITEDYEIIITKNGYVTQDLKTLPGVTTYTVLMPETGGSASYEFDNFAWSFRPLSNNIASIPFNASINVADELNSLSIFRFNIYDSNGNILFSDSSTSPSGGSFDTTINNVSSFYIYNLSGTRNGVNFEILKTYNFINETNTNTSIKQLAETLNGDENNSERIFIMMIIYIGFMVFGAFFSPGIGAMLGIIPLIIFATVGWLPVGIALLLGIFNGLGGYFFRG